MTDRFQLEVLTQGFSTEMNFYENDVAIQMSRAFGAFRIAVAQLRDYYRDFVFASRRLHSSPEMAIRLKFPYPDDYIGPDGNEVKFTYNSRVDDGKLMFIATTTEGLKIFIKFTRRYSLEAHQLCAKPTAAPTLYGFQRLYGGWFMAIMEYLDPETYEHLKPRTDNTDRLVAEVKLAVEVLHEGGYVHGDIRRGNTMTRRHWSYEKGAKNVLLIDFDWAGLEGQARYPANINYETIRRPQDARYNNLITKEHDNIMVEYLF
jgi:hypothetical protein